MSARIGELITTYLGWAKLLGIGGGTWHWFVRGRSLCQRVELREPADLLPDDYDDDDFAPSGGCPLCRSRLESRLP